MKISDLDFSLTLAHAIASDFFQHLLGEKKELEHISTHPS